MAIYASTGTYISEAKTNAERLARVEKVIDALLETAANSAGSDNITSYSMDDGQTKIQTTYKGVDAIMRSIAEFEKLKNYYKNQIDGRITRMVDSKNLSRYRYGNGRG